MKVISLTPIYQKEIIWFLLDKIQLIKKKTPISFKRLVSFLILKHYKLMHRICGIDFVFSFFDQKDNRNTT
jgi:hypothetical protein